MKKICMSIVAIFFVLSLVVAPVMLTVLPKETFSENENRPLASFPEFNIEEVKSGRFTENLKTYFVDHFPMRDQFVGMKTMVELSLGKKVINNIIVCDNGYYMNTYDNSNIKSGSQSGRTDKFINSVNKLCSNLDKAEVTVMPIPTAIYIYNEYVPGFIKSNDQKADLEHIYSSVNCDSIDVSETLLSNKDNAQLYYKLDHHWTTYAAFLAYNKYCSDKKLTPAAEDDFSIESVTSDFKGTIFSKVHDYTAAGERITCFFQDDIELDVYYKDKDKHTNTLYEKSFLDKKDKYSYFLNGQQSLIEIENKTIHSNKEIVVVKDSYANCFIPFLVNNYKKVYVVDSRYWNNGISDYVNGLPNVNDVLIFYNLGTMDTDIGISKIF